MSDDFNAEEAVAKSVEPGTFSFIERLVGRSYPTSDLRLYLNEQAAFDRLVLLAELQDAAIPAERRVEIEAEIEKIDATLAESRYVITLKGFAPERYDEILEELDRQYPPEYKEHINMFSGERTEEEILNKDRNKLLLAMLWAESIVKITDPNGVVEETSLDNGTAARMRANMPLDARRKIDVRIQELRLTSAWIDEVQDEGFLATP